MATNYKDFAAKIKSKYPDYKDVDDRILAEKMVEKYPDYKDQVTFEPDYVPQGKFGESVAPQGSILRKILPSAGDVPALIGGTFGGLAGAGMATGTGLAALFSGGGEALHQIGQRIFGNKEAPRTSMEAAERIGKAGLFGGAGELGARVIGKFFAPFKAGTTPEIQEGINIAKSEGIVPGVGERTKSLFVKGVENAAERSPAGVGLTLQKEESLRQLEALAKRTADEIGTDRPTDTFGSLVMERVKSFKETFRLTKDELYDQVDLSNIPTKLDNTTKALENTIKNRGGAFEPPQLKEIQVLLDKIKKSPMLPDAEKLKIWRTNIGKLAKSNDPAMTGIKSNYQAIEAAISKDLEEAVGAKSPELLDKLKQADEFFSQGINSLKDETYKKLIKAKPSDIPDLLFKPDTPELIQAGKEILGDDGMKDVARKWFEQVLNSSKVQKGVDTFIDPKKLVNAINKYGSTIDEMFMGDKKALNALDRLRKVSGLMSTEGIGAVDNSLLAGTIKTLAGFFAAPAMKSEKGILGLFGKVHLTEGYPKAEFAVRRSVQPAVQEGLSKIFKNDKK